MDYEFTDDMYEITGEGGNREKACQRALAEVMRWRDKTMLKIQQAITEGRSPESINENGKHDHAFAEHMKSFCDNLAKEYGLERFPTPKERILLFKHVAFIKKKGWAAYVKESKANKARESMEKAFKPAKPVPEVVKRAVKKLGDMHKKEEENRPLNMNKDGSFVQFGHKDIQA